MTSINAQKKLMQMALNKLNEIDLARNILKKGDPMFYKVTSDGLKKEYLDIMYTLQLELNCGGNEIEYANLWRESDLCKN